MSLSRSLPSAMPSAPSADTAARIDRKGIAARIVSAEGERRCRTHRSLDRERQPRPRTLAALFERCAPEPNSGCWLFTGHLNSSGYGKVGNKTLVHRLAWALAHGAVPHDLQVLHRCDTRACCNPAHLFIGTHGENMADMVAKGRQACGRKTRNRAVKLSEAAVEEIRRLKRSGRSQNEIARAFGVTKSSVSYIVRNITWKAAA